MKKGDDRRRKILETAQRLFYERGYEQTSVQDILDEMELSKGGFYHHFESKIQLLEAICVKRAEDTQEKMQEVIAAQSGAVERLNALLSMCSLWRRDSLDFTSLMLRVAYKGDSALLRERMHRVTYECALPHMDALVKQGMDEGVFYTRYPDELGSLLLKLYVSFMDEVARMLAESEDKNTAIARVIGRLPVYRQSMELLLNAPFGSIVLVEAEKLAELLGALAL